MEIAALNALNVSFKAALPTADINALSPIGGGLTKGFESTIESFGYHLVQGNLKLTNDQKITIAGVETVIPAGSAPVSLGFKFADGSQIALSTLRRSALSSIGGKSTRAMSAQDFDALVGKKIKVADVAKDSSTERVNRVTVNGTEVERPNVGKSYSIALV